MESEHRALDDTKLSIELFCRYISEISTLRWSNINLWHHASLRDSSGMISTLLSITERSENSSAFTLPLSYNRSESLSRKYPEFRNSTIHPHTIVSLSGRSDEEREQIEASLAISSPLLILTPNKKQCDSLAKSLKNEWYTPHIYKDQANFCSIEMLSYWLNREIWNRKESIFIIKLTSWILETQTWLLDELKYYWDERSFMELFRSDTSEMNPFFDRQRQESQNTDILIADLSAGNIESESIIPGEHSLIVRDVMWMEDAIRRKKSHHISFRELFSLSEWLSERTLQEDLITGFSILSDIYRSVPERPKWAEEFPPGDFGETYLITQKNLWHTWYAWLILATEKLKWAKNQLKLISTQNPIERQNKEKLEKYLDILIRISLVEDTNLSIILSILPEDTKISFIPRDVHEDIQGIISSQSGKKNTLLGYGIANSANKAFLERECGIFGEITGKAREKILTSGKQVSLPWEKNVILTTSIKHARMLAREFQWKQDIKNIYTQGISGGKGKMLSLFQHAKEKSLLIGIINTWIDEGELWKTADVVIVAKVPFDPPTDTYFLARTVGMKNNFEEYSSPIAINTLNTLIGRIHSTNEKTTIIAIDDRLQTMNWWQSMKECLL